MKVDRSRPSGFNTPVTAVWVIAVIAVVAVVAVGLYVAIHMNEVFGFATYPRMLYGGYG